jgi:hypothetical protein
MRIRVLTSSVVALLTLLSGSALLQAQAPDTQSNKKVYGYQDPQSGTFRALPTEAPTEGTSTPLTGTLKVVLNITVKSTWPAGTARTIVCSADFDQISITGTAVTTPYIEEVSRYATAATSGYTCTLTIPYSWLIPTTAIQKTLTGSYSVGVQNTAVAAGPPILRLSNGPIVSTTTLPATGTTTTYTIAVTI